MSPLRWVRTRLSVRLALTMLFVSLAPLAAAGIIVLRVIERSIEEQVRARHNELAAVASAEVRDHIDRALDKLRSISRIVGEEPTAAPQQYKGQNRAQMEQLKPDQLTARLNRFIAPPDVFVNLAYRSVGVQQDANPPPTQQTEHQKNNPPQQDANNYYDNGQRAQVQRADLNPKQQSWMNNWSDLNVLNNEERGNFMVASCIGGTEYVGPELTSADDLVFLPMAVPIRDKDDKDRVFALLSATLDFKPVLAALTRHAADARSIRLVDGRGRVVAETSAAPADPIETPRHVGHAGWKVVVVEPREVAYRPLAQARMQAVALIGGTGVAAFGLSLLLAAWILRPVRRLTAAADAMRDGALGTRSGIARDDEIGRLARSFDQMAAALQELDQLKSEFVAHVSHELRTPLTAMQLSVANLQDGVAGPLDTKQQSILARIGGDIERLIKLVNEVLDVARIEAGKLELVRTPVDLAEVARGAVAILEPLAKGKGAAVECVVEPCTVQGDRAKLHQVVTNLVDNAIKFTPAGGRIGVRVSGGKIVVSDTGPGIAPERLPRIFDRFARAGAENAGAGLGLSIAKKIVELHGGTISVESAVGKGSTFTVTLAARS